MRMRRERLDAMLGNNNEYLYDAFISCTREGVKWAKKYLLPKLENQDTGLKFCVAQRDFLVGKTIIDNIMDTISKSRKDYLTRWMKLLWRVNGAKRSYYCLIT